MSFTRRTNILFALIASILLIVAIFFGWKAYRDSQPQSYIDFKQFSPTKIVGGLHITEKNVETWESHPLLWFRPYSVKIRLSLESPFSFISESKSKGDGTADATNFTCTATNTKCFSKTTPKGQIYLLKHVYDPTDLKATPLAYDELSEQSIRFERDGTSISVLINGIATPISGEDWSAMIDSFEPTTFTDLKVKHMQPGP